MAVVSLVFFFIILFLFCLTELCWEITDFIYVYPGPSLTRQQKSNNDECTHE